MGQTVYVEVKALTANILADIPSGHHVTNGYYITYEMSENGGFMSSGWFWNERGNPLNAAGLNDFEAVQKHYTGNGGNLSDVFGNWKANLGGGAGAEDDVHSFINFLWDNARNCISMP